MPMQYSYSTDPKAPARNNVTPKSEHSNHNQEFKDCETCTAGKLPKHDSRIICWDCRNRFQVEYTAAIEQMQREHKQHNMVWSHNSSSHRFGRMAHTDWRTGAAIKRSVERLHDNVVNGRVNTDACELWNYEPRLKRD